MQIFYELRLNYLLQALPQNLLNVINSKENIEYVFAMRFGVRMRTFPMISCRSSVIFIIIIILLLMRCSAKMSLIGRKINANRKTNGFSGCYCGVCKFSLKEGWYVENHDDR